MLLAQFFKLLLLLDVVGVKPIVNREDNALRVLDFSRCKIGLLVQLVGSLVVLLVCLVVLLRTGQLVQRLKQLLVFVEPPAALVHLRGEGALSLLGLSQVDLRHLYPALLCLVVCQTVEEFLLVLGTLARLEFERLAIDGGRRAKLVARSRRRTRLFVALDHDLVARRLIVHFDAEALLVALPSSTQGVELVYVDVDAHRFLEPQLRGPFPIRFLHFLARRLLFV